MAVEFYWNQYDSRPNSEKPSPRLRVDRHYISVLFVEDWAPERNGGLIWLHVTGPKAELAALDDALLIDLVRAHYHGR
jgi:hypothetical protein